MLLRSARGGVERTITSSSSVFGFISEEAIPPEVGYRSVRSISIY
jgi:hypothetical protein